MFDFFTSACCYLDRNIMHGWANVWNSEAVSHVYGCWTLLLRSDGFAHLCLAGSVLVHIHDLQHRSAWTASISVMSLHLQSWLLVNDITRNAPAVVVHHVLCHRQKCRSNQAPSIRRRLFWKRQWRSVFEFYKKHHGDVYLQASLLCPGIFLRSKKKWGSRDHSHNGPILEKCLAGALLHWFSGGTVYDLMTSFRISAASIMIGLLMIIKRLIKNHLMRQFLYCAESMRIIIIIMI